MSGRCRLLYVEFEKVDASAKPRSHSTTPGSNGSAVNSWLEVRVNDQVRIPKLVGDGALVSTAAGSTAYARSWVARRFLQTHRLADCRLATCSIRQAGSRPFFPPKAHVAIRNIGGEKQRGCVVWSMAALRVSEVEALRARLKHPLPRNLAFCPQHDMAEKLRRSNSAQRADALAAGRSGVWDRKDRFVV